MSNFLHDLAKAHQQHEGFYPGSLSYRQNNPGNLRGKGGVFMSFRTYSEGFAALQYDIKAKITGVAGSIQRYMKGTGKLYEQLVMFEYIAIYAPSADKNNPVAYCDALCRELDKYHITPQTPLSVLAKLITGELAQAPDPPPAPLSNEQRLKIAQNALKWADGTRRNMLLQLIDRLLQRIS